MYTVPKNHILELKPKLEQAPMNRIQTGAIFRLLFCIALTIFVSNSKAVGSKLQDFEYSIISAVIKHGLGDDNRNIIIDESTTGESINVVDPERTPEEFAEELGTTSAALREWSLINRDRYRLEQQLSLGGPYHLLSNNERLKIFNHSDPDINWQQFRSHFPNAHGIIRVSRPSTDATVISALLYLEFECGAKCGSGRLINLIQTIPNQWQVTSGSLLWITAAE